MNGSLWTSFSSEIVLLLTAAINLMFQKRCRPTVLSWVSSAGILCAIGFTLLGATPIAQILKIMELLICWVSVMMTAKSQEIDTEDKSDVLAILLLTTMALLVMVSTTNLLVLFLALEAAGMGVYVLCSFRNKNPDSSEASIKYFFHAALSTLLLACGLLLLYAKSGSFDVQTVRLALAKTAESSDPSTLIIAFALMTASLFARMSIFPFHGALIDAVDGAPSPVSAYILTSRIIISTTSAFVVLLELFGVRIESGWKSLSTIHWSEILILISTITMVLGNLAALSQQSMKRWFAYFFLAQISFTFVGLAIANHIGVTAMLFMQCSLLFSALGAWFVMQEISDSAGDGGLSAFDGLAKRSPFACTILSLFLLSMAGIPPLSGFIGKFYLLGTIIEQKSNWLIAAMFLNWIFSTAAILTVMRRFFHNHIYREPLRIHFSDRVAFIIMCVPVFFLGLTGDYFMKYLMRSIESVQHFF